MLEVSYTRLSGNQYLEKYPLSGYRINKLYTLTNDIPKQQGIAADILLQKMLGFMPEIDLSESGKPVLLNSALEFNLSHSGDFAACAVSDTPVGIDIQKRNCYKPSIAKRCFTDDEFQYLERSEDEELAFLEIWCRKESYLKATGTGITVNLNSFSVFKDTGDYKFHTIAEPEFFLAVCRKKDAEPDKFAYIDLS